jgi:hypothetical protein
MVIIGCAPAAFVSRMNVSALSPAIALSSPIDSKNQSAARLLALSCQL